MSVTRQMRITFSSLDSVPRRSHEIASEYHITWPRRCLLYATFKNESDLDLQDQDRPKKYSSRSTSHRKCDRQDQDQIIKIT